MSQKKLNQLLAAARKAEPPVLSASLAEDVVRALGQMPSHAESRPSLFDELNAGFARLATAVALILVLGVAANFALSNQESSDLSDGVAQLSAQWFLVPSGI